MTHARHERLTRYAAAASIVSLGGIATADIIHRDVEQSMTFLTGYDTSTLIINALTGSTSLRWNASAGNAGASSFAFKMQRGGINAKWSASGGAGLKQFFDEGQVIDGSMSLGWNLMAYQQYYYPNYYANFTYFPNSSLQVNVPTYIGFGIDDTADSVGTLYGWAQIMFTNNGVAGGRLTLDIIDYAYDDTGAAITAGQMPSTSVVPGAGGLVALACGAAGLRRRRKPATTSATTETA